MVDQLFIVKTSIGMLGGIVTGTGTMIIFVTETTSEIRTLSVSVIVIEIEIMREGMILIGQENMPLIEAVIVVPMVKNVDETMTKIGKGTMKQIGIKIGRWIKAKITIRAEGRSNSQEIDLGML